MKNGLYGMYQGKVYKIVVDNTNSFEIITSDLKSIDNSFEQDDDIYYKNVSASDIDEAYHLYSRCIYKGVEFTCLGENEEDDTYLLMGDESHGEKFPMKIIDRGESIMTVPRSEAEYFEVKKPYDLKRLNKTKSVI